tara:strand:- start:130 stop:891 length:762 start_codon:yes stop_codon:yes gene_type:complete
MNLNLNKNPKITIITVVKNNEKYLEENIKSLINQTYQNYEHIIVDGLSTDKTMDIVTKYKNKIHKIISEKDNGLYDAINKGIQNASGDIIGILNSDDYFYNDALNIVRRYFESFPDIDFLFGTVFKHRVLHGYRPWKIKWTFGFYTTHSVGFFIKKSSQWKVGLYSLNYKYSSDYDLFYRMIVKLKMKGMATKKKEVLGFFRPGGLSSKIKYIDFLNENTQIRLNNGQNKIIVKIIYFLRYIKRIKQIYQEKN